MNVFNHIISEELVHALGWTVLHSLWQAMAVAVLLAFLNLLLQRQPPRLRYLIGNIGLLFVLLMSVVTFLDLYRPATETVQMGIEAVSIQGAASQAEVTAMAPTMLERYLQQFTFYFNQHLPLIVLMWLLGASVFALRLLGGLAYLQHLKFNGAAPVSEYWQRRAGRLAGRLGVRRPVQLLESTLAATPMVIGHLKPVILMPVGALNALTPQQVEAILAHELAHIARHDYLLNMLQSMVEVLFYFNPAVWWISSYIRTERENCCDDIAVSVCGDPLGYARALVSLQELCQPAPQLALTLGRKRQYLLNRVRRLLNQPQKRSFLAERITATLILFLIVIIVPIASASPERDKSTVDRDETASTFLPLAPLPRIHLDTLPLEETTLEVVKGNGERLKATIKDRKIQQLEIDGEEIPESRFSEYQEEIEEYLVVSEPPAPPVPPAPPAPPAPSMVAPPAPPVPPAPPAPHLKDKDIRSIEIIEGEDGRRRIIIKGDGNAQIEMDPMEGFAFDFDWPDSLAWSGQFGMDIKDLHLEQLTDSLDQIFRQFPKGSFYFGESMPQDLEDRLRELTEKYGETWNEERMQKLMEQREELIQPFMEKMRDSFENFPESFDFDFDFDRMRFDERFNLYSDDGFRVHGSNFVMNEQVRSRLEEALLADGLVTDTEQYRLKLATDEFVVDGQRQPESVARKYRALYEEAAGVKMREGTTFEIHKEPRE